MGSSNSVIKKVEPPHHPPPEVNETNSLEGDEIDCSGKRSVDKMNLIMKDRTLRKQFMKYLSEQGKLPYIKCFQDLELLRKQMIQQQQHFLKSRSTQTGNIAIPMYLTIPGYKKYFVENKKTSRGLFVVPVDIKENIKKSLAPLIELKAIATPQGENINKSNSKSSSNDDSSNSISTETTDLLSINSNNVATAIAKAETFIEFTMESFLLWLDKIVDMQEDMLSHLLINVQEFDITLQPSPSVVPPMK